MINSKGGATYLYQKFNNRININKQVEFLPYYQDRKDLFQHLTINNDSIVFLGDSLIDYNEWSEAFGNNPNIKNRGIGGDRIDGVLGRIDDIVSGHPRKIFLEIGVNDLNSNENVDEISTKYERIIKFIQEKSPSTELYIHSVFPINGDKNSALTNVKNNSIAKLNNRIRILADKHKVTFIDVYSQMENQGEMNKDLTTDGVHLNAKGYTIWEDAIRKYVEQ